MMRREVDPGFDGTPKAADSRKRYQTMLYLHAEWLRHSLHDLTGVGRDEILKLVSGFGRILNGYPKDARVVPLSARVVEDDGRRRVLIEADENGQWPKAVIERFNSALCDWNSPTRIAMTSMDDVLDNIRYVLNALALAEGGSE